MNKLLAITLVLLLAMAVPVIADNNTNGTNGNGSNNGNSGEGNTDTVGTQATVRAKVRLMGALGNGIAISQSDPMDFELLKVGIAGYRVITNTGETETRVGILYFGETKYKVKDIVIGNGTITGNVYDLDDTQVGSIAVDSYVKGDREIWAGPLTLNDNTYNAYIIQQPRSVKAEEKARHAFSYCEDNPGQCMKAMQQAGSIICDPENEGTTCVDMIKNYCEDNPEDRKCVALRYAYCKLNLEDADCRAEIMERCKQNVNEEACEKLGQMYNKALEKKPTAATNMPTWMKTVRNKIAAKLTNQQKGAGNG